MSLDEKIRIPALMRIETTNYCNEACSFCPYPTLEREKGRMSFDLFDEVTDEHSQRSDARILFPATVGEPLLDKRIFDFVKLAAQKYGKVSMFTNSSLLDEERARKLIEAGLTEIMFTLHGLTADYFRKITGFKDYEKVRENIARFLELNVSEGSPVTVFFNIYSPHEREAVLADGLVSRSVELGINLTIHSIEDAHNWAGLKDSERKERIKGCGRIYSQFGVLYDGRVVPCCVDSEARYPLGNVNNQSLRGTFSSEKYLHLQQKEQERMLREISLCRYCDLD